MKRLFVLFAVLAFTACTNEEPVGSAPLSEEVGTPTFATFTFNVQDAATKSSMITDENETDVINGVRVLLFRMDNTLEVDTSITTSSGNSEITILMISGAKRIFAIANAGNGMLPVKGSGFTYTDFNRAYNISNTNPVNDPTTGIDNLSNLVKPTGYVMSSSVRTSAYIVTPGITAAQSQEPSNPNHLSIDLQRAVAKVTVYQDADASSLTTLDGSGTLSDLKYSITNVNRSLYLFQNYNASSILVTPEYIPTQSVDPLVEQYYYRYYNFREVLTELSASKAIYITENNPSTKMTGNTTCIGVEAVFMPKKDNFTKDISYNAASGTFTVTLSETDLETASDMYVFTSYGMLGLNRGTLLAGVDAGKLAKKVTYHILNPTVYPKASLDDPVYAAITDNEVTTYFDKYTDGKCYYRLDIGHQTNGNQIDYTVRRNYHYKVGITAYLRIGTPQMKMLLMPIEEVLQGGTNITASFNVVDWIDELINGVG
jgi:hypothetical protein